MGSYRKKRGPKRPESKRKRRRYLIVSEDSKSSLDYFLSFPVDPKLVDIVPEGGAGNTVDVVQRGIDMKLEAEKNKEPFAHVYCVFDEDNRALDRYQAAFSKAQAHNDVTAIWANECFELWYLLHFEYRNSALGRGQLYKILETSARLGKEYDKSDKQIYDALLDKQDTAIANSQRLHDSALRDKPHFPWRVNPSTNVHEIVEQLNNLAALTG